MFRQYNPNPSGLMVDDCAIRAICCLEGMFWEDVALQLFVKSMELYDVQTSQVVFNAYLKKIGYTKNQIPNTCPDCYTVNDFCVDHSKGKFIVATQTHVIAIIDGDHYDTWDSSQEPILWYWVRKE